MLALNEQNFTQKVEQSPHPVVVMFFASWCSRCAMMRPLAEDAEKTWRNRISFFEVDIEKCKNLAARYQVEIYPTFVFFQKGAYVGSIEGTMNSTTFQKQIQRIFTIY